MQKNSHAFSIVRAAKLFRLLVCALAIGAILPNAALALGGGTKEKLKNGGYVIVMRYAQTPKGLGDPPGFDINNCATQRNLTDIGRADTRHIHERFQKAGIKITKALSSRWCRAIETAKLMAPDVTVEPRDELAALLNRKELAVRREIIVKVRAEIGAWRGPGNLLLVSHKRTIRAITGKSLSKGGYLVIDPKTLKIIAEDD